MLQLPGQVEDSQELQDKLDYIAQQFPTGPYIDAKRSFGARGDGTTDDTKAIQAAIDRTYEAGGGTVFLPNGVYPVDALSRTWSDRITVNLQGSGKRATVLQKTGAGTDPVLTYTGSSVPTETYSNIFDLAILGNGKAHDGIKLDGVARFNFSNLDIRGCDKAINGYRTLVFNVDSCTLQENNTGIYGRGTNSVPPNAVNLTNSEICLNTSRGVDWDDGSELWMRGCDLEQNGTAADTTTGAIFVGSNASGTLGYAAFHVSDCWFEANLGRMISARACYFAMDKCMCLQTGGDNSIYMTNMDAFTADQVLAPSATITINTQMRVRLESVVGGTLTLPTPAAGDDVMIVNCPNFQTILPARVTTITGTSANPTNVPYNSVYVDSTDGTHLRFRDNAGTVHVY